jgi:hypothetical protein
MHAKTGFKNSNHCSWQACMDFIFFRRFEVVNMRTSLYLSSFFNYVDNFQMFRSFWHLHICLWFSVEGLNCTIHVFLRVQYIMPMEVKDVSCLRSLSHKIKHMPYRTEKDWNAGTIILNLSNNTGFIKLIIQCFRGWNFVQTIYF